MAKSNRISKYDFSLLFQKIGLHDGQFIDRLYIAADKQRNGEVRPQDIITSVALLVPPDQKDEPLSLLFDLWDRDADGALTQEEFCQFYKYVRRKDPNAYSLLISSSEKEPYRPGNLRRQVGNKMCTCGTVTADRSLFVAEAALKVLDAIDSRPEIA